MENYKDILEISEKNSSGYHIINFFESWRVAIYNEKPEYLANYMERHLETDEVFILLKGKCKLFVSEEINQIEDIKIVEMLPINFYNVKSNIWHNIMLYDGGSVAIVENHNTSKLNTEYFKLKEQEILELNKKI